MAKLDTKLEITTGLGDTYICDMQDNYDEVYRTMAKVDNSDGFTSVASLLKSNNSILKGSKVIVLKNNSPVGVELQFRMNEFGNNLNKDTFQEEIFVTQYLAGGEYMLLPNQFMLGYNSLSESAANAKTTDNATGASVNATLAVDSTADIDSATASGIIGSSSATRVYLEPYTSASNCTANLFVVGDLIRVDDEIMEVTAIGDKSDLANNYIDVKRGMFGSTAASDHADDEPVEFPYFNTQDNFDKFSYAQTNGSGRYTAKNLFGYGRQVNLDLPTGIVKGSLAFKFYNSGYQELGLSGITPSTHTGLAASTTYQFNITVDGGSTFVDLAFTTDATNLNFGGNNGVLQKIQAALDTQFYTSGNLFEKQVTVGIVNGDVRFTSGNKTNVSAIALAAPSSGTTPFGVGRIPAIGSVETAIPALLPDDTIFSNDSYIEISNVSAFAYDDGKGNILGAATGTINYQTGEIDFTGPANAEFAVSFNYDSAHSGGVETTDEFENGLIAIAARSMNSKIDAEIEVLGFV